MGMRAMWSGLKETISEFMADDATTLGGALAFYSALSLAPLLMLMITIAGLVLSVEQQQEIIEQIQITVGSRAGEVIGSIVESARQNKGGGSIAAVIGIATLILGATAVFAQLQYSMNRIWGVEHKPGGGVWAWIRKRLLSLMMICVIGGLLIASVVISTAVSGMVGQGMVGQVVDVIASVAVFTLLFATIFKVLPDVKIDWRTTWLGAAITAVLFVAGKFALGMYLSYGGVGSAYGAAGSLIALLVWVYYSSLIIFFGAEMTQVYAAHVGAGIQPDEHAQPASCPPPHKAVQQQQGGRPCPPTARQPHPA